MFGYCFIVIWNTKLAKIYVCFDVVFSYQDYNYFFMDVIQFPKRLWKQWYFDRSPFCLFCSCYVTVLLNHVLDCSCVWFTLFIHFFDGWLEFYHWLRKFLKLFFKFHTTKTLTLLVIWVSSKRETMNSMYNE